MTIKLIFKNFVKLLVDKSPKGYHITLKHKFKYIIEYLNKIFPLLNNPKYNLGTKIYWLLHDINDFPKCKRYECNKVLKHKNAIVTTGYGSGYCSISCEMNDVLHLEILKEIFQERFNADSFPESQLFLECIHKFYENITDELMADINRKREETCLNNFGVKNALCKDSKIRLEFEEKNLIEHGTRKWNNSEKAIQTRKLHNIEDENFLKNINEKTKNTKELKRLIDPNYDNKIFEKIRKTKAQKRQEDPDYDKKIIEKTMTTNFNNTGYYWPSLNPNIRKKMYRKYTYDNIMFDSSLEIAYYIWLTDNNIDFIYHPDTNILYLGSDNKIHMYEPDFLLLNTNTLVDIKGDHFFKTTIFKNAKEKYKCMLDNNVTIITSNTYSIFMKYCELKFNDKKWFLQFKNF